MIRWFWLSTLRMKSQVWPSLRTGSQVEWGKNENQRAKWAERRRFSFSLHSILEIFCRLLGVRYSEQLWFSSSYSSVFLNLNLKLIIHFQYVITAFIFKYFFHIFFFYVLLFLQFVPKLRDRRLKENGIIGSPALGRLSSSFLSLPFKRLHTGVIRVPWKLIKYYY